MRLGVARDDAIDQRRRVAAGDDVFEERRDVDEPGGVADRVVLVLVQRLVRARRVVAGPLAVAEALDERQRPVVEWRADGHRRSIAADYNAVDPVPAKYDAIIIGAGHNGLTAAAYLARAGRKVLVLERRHVVGGAAVTEEIFPGFKFSVCSYVVSLLRPEIIRELELARHGLEILPLDGTFTPMLTGDYLWRVNDHARTFREISRHSRADAEVYDEYGRAMVEMGRFAKDILAMTPPDPFSMRMRDLSAAGRSAQALPRAAGTRSPQPAAAADDERRRFPRPVVRDRRAQGDDVGVGHHRDVSGRAITRHGVRAAPSLHGRHRRRVPIVGPVQGRHRHGVRVDRRRGARVRRRDSR